MDQLQLKSLVRMKQQRMFKGQMGRVAPDTMARGFAATQPNEKWVTDVTEFNVGGAKLYRSLLMDLYNGEMVACETAVLTPGPSHKACRARAIAMIVF